MADEFEHSAETPKKRPAKPFRGAIDGVPFTSENQPTPEQKKKGWEEVRKQRLLTQSLLKALFGKDLDNTEAADDYALSLIRLAKDGNPKAIDTINKAIEDDIQKIHLSGEVKHTQITYIQQSGNEPIKES